MYDNQITLGSIQTVHNDKHIRQCDVHLGSVSSVCVCQFACELECVCACVSVCVYVCEHLCNIIMWLHSTIQCESLHTATYKINTLKLYW